jgi:hypothetical protein
MIMKVKRCPYCGAVVDFEDMTNEFDDFEDCGSHILATGKFNCECGEELIISAKFVWDEEFEVR